MVEVGAIRKLKEYCKRIGGKFMEHSPYSATCFFPEARTADVVRVVKEMAGITLGNKPVAEIFIKGDYPLEILADEKIVMDIGGDSLSTADVAKLSTGGSEIRNVTISSIFVKTDPLENTLYVELR